MFEVCVLPGHGTQLQWQQEKAETRMLKRKLKLKTHRIIKRVLFTGIVHTDREQ